MAAAGALRHLRQSPIFGALPEGEIKALAAVAIEETYRPRDYVFMEGDPARWVCLVVSGRVRIVRHSRTGKDVVLEILGPGEVFGAVAVIERRPYPAAGQAMAPATVLKIPGDAVVALAERHPSLVKELALMIGRRLRSAHESVKSLAVDPVEARVAATLLRLVSREGDAAARPVTLPFHLTRQGLADMTGTTVETAIRIVSRWMRDGLVQDEGGRLVLLDPAALRAIAEGGA
jgi:CRP/FNR family transcriptional regulator